MKILCLLVLSSITVGVSGGNIVPEDRKMSTASQQVGMFLRQLLNEHLHSSTGGVCYFIAPTTLWRTVQEFLWIRQRTGGWRNRQRIDVVRLCDKGSCLTAQNDTETRCEVAVVVMRKTTFQEHLRVLSSVPFWTPSAIHVFLNDGFATTGSKDHQLTEALAMFGVIRSIVVQVDPRAGTFTVQFPMLFQRRVVRIPPTEASRWLREFDQVADLYGYQYRTLYHTLIPYLYRYDGVFDGPDYTFLQTVLARQNASHHWIYHRFDDASLNSTDLHLVDQRLLERGRVSFSINRLLAIDRSTVRLEKLYLNTFDGTCVLVPRARLQTFILRLWKPFSPYVWYTVLAIVLLAIVGNLALPQLFVVNYLLALLFGSKVLDYRLHALDRTILLTLDVLLFLLKEAYTAKIITYMIQTQYEPELETVAQLAQTGPPLLLTPGDYHTLRESLASVPTLHIVLRHDFSSFHTNWREYFRSTFAHAVPCSYGRALVGSHSMHEPNAPKFYLLRERLRIQPEAFTFPPHQPFIGKMRFFVASLLETGIYDAWLRGDYYARDRSPTLDEILRFENLASLFYVLLFGYAVSLTVFFVELFVSAVRANVTKKRIRQFWTRARLAARWTKTTTVVKK